MDANGIIGREYEQKLIQERCKSNKAELIAIYGRRRVGKTFLVRKMFNDLGGKMKQNQLQEKLNDKMRQDEELEKMK